MTPVSSPTPEPRRELTKRQRATTHAAGIYLVLTMVGVLLLAAYVSPLVAATLAGGSYVVAFTAGMLVALGGRDR